jgi:uncharacterized protein
VNARVGLAGLALLACAWTVPAMAADFTVPPTPVHRVTDNAGALSSDTQTSLENELRTYQTATGHQVIVWIGDTTGDVPLETWTGDTAHQWRIGRRGHDDGAILFLFMKDHKVRIEVGYGLEGSLTDADSSRIIQNDIVPRMKAGDVDGAVSGGIAAMLKTITPSYAGVTPPPEPTQSAAGTGIAVVVIAITCLIFGFIIFMIVMRVIGSLRYGYLVMREGKTKAKTDMKNFWFWGGTGAFVGSSFGGGGGSDFGGGDDFSAGGGDFGGGGASGSW